MQEKKGPRDGLVDVVGFHQLAGLTGKLEQLLDRVAAALGIPQDALQVLARLGGQLVILQHDLAEEGDAGEWIVELMGHAGGEFAQGGHFLGLQQLHLGLFQFALDAQLFAAVVKEPDAGDLLVAVADQGGVEVDGNGGAVLAHRLGGVEFQLVPPAILLAAQLAHDLVGLALGVDLADIQVVQGLGDRVAGDFGGRVVEYEDLAGFIRRDDPVHGAADQVAEKGVGALEAVLQLLQHRQVEIHHHDGLQDIVDEQRVGIQTGHAPGVGLIGFDFAQRRLVGLEGFLGGAARAGRKPVVDGLVAHGLIGGSLDPRALPPTGRQDFEIGRNHDDFAVEMLQGLQEKGFFGLRVHGSPVWQAGGEPVRRWPCWKMTNDPAVKGLNGPPACGARGIKFMGQ